MTPQYIIDIYNKLSSEYSDVEYCSRIDGEYCIFDCFIISGKTIILDRLEEDILSENGINTVVENIREIYECMSK